MTIPLTGAGSLGVRLGSLMWPAASNFAQWGGTATAEVTAGIPSDILGTVIPNYSAGVAAPQAIPNLQGALAQAQQSAVTFATSTLPPLAANTLQVMYGYYVLGIPANSPLSAFQGISIGRALQGLYNQMVLNTQTVQSPTVTAGAQTNVGTPVGNGAIVVSLKNGLGQALALVYPETLAFRCISDSYTGGRTIYNELLQINGTPAQSKQSALWPGGSGVTAQISAVNPLADNSQGNLLQNSTFNVFTSANNPDNWTIAVGTAGTHVIDAGSGHAYMSGNTHSLGIVGNASTLTDLTQKFNTTPSTTVGGGGTAANLVPYPDNVLHLCAFMAVNTTPAAGHYIFDLFDGSAIVQNDAGVDQSITFDITSLSTTFLAFTGAFQLPKTVPSTLYLRQRQASGNAISSGTTLYVGSVSLTRAASSSITPPAGVGSMVQGIYSGGPFVSFHSGNVALVNGLVPDSWTIAMANNYSTKGDGLFQQFLSRWFNIETLGLQLPTSGSPTLADSVITN